MLDFNEKDNETVDIPDFVEDKTESKSIDMSIFKMSDEELYDDQDEDQDDLDEETFKVKRKINTSAIWAILCVVFLVLSVVCGVLMFKAKSTVSDLEAQVKQLQATQASYQQQLQEKDNTISSLNAQIEQMKKVDEGTRYKITADSVNFRTSASIDANKTSYNDHEVAWKNEVFKVLEIVTDSSGNKWAKLDDNTYFAIVYNNESLASKVE